MSFMKMVYQQSISIRFIAKHGLSGHRGVVPVPKEGHKEELKSSKDWECSTYGYGF